MIIHALDFRRLPVRGRAFALAVLLFLWGANRLFALGQEDFGPEPLHAANFTTWPGVLAVINTPSRVYHSWVNGNEHFLFEGDVAALNAVLADFGKIKDEHKRIVLRQGQGSGRSFQKTDPIRFDWELQLFGGIAQHMLTLDQGDQVWPKGPQLTIYLEKFSLTDLKLPEDVPITDVLELSEKIVTALGKSTDQTVRGWGCGQLAALDALRPENLKAVIERLHDRESWVQLNAAGAIPLFGHLAQPYLDDLRSLLTSGDQQLRKQAEESIKAIEAAPVTTGENERSVATNKGIHEWVVQRRAVKK